MAKPEWGVKRACLSCGGRFYDMRKSPIVCPKCEATFEPEATLRARRVQRTAPDKKPKVEAPPPEVKTEEAPVAEDETAAVSPDDEVETDDDGAGDGDGDDGEDTGIIEDTSDLGEGDVDVPTVASNDDDK